MYTSESIRLGKFRQLKQEIRGSKEHLIVGIDVAKHKQHAFLGTANGRTLLRRLVFNNNREGFIKLLSHVELAKARHCLKKVVFGLEPTGTYHKPLAEFLIRQGETVVLVSSVSVRRNRELLDGRWDKNDTKDAANVADLISQGKCLFYEHPPKELRDLRNLLSLKAKLKKMEHGFRIRIRNHLLAQYFPELDRHFGHTTAENLAVVKWCLDPAELSSLEYEEFYQRVTTRERGQAQHAKLRAIWEESSRSIGCEVGGSAKYEAKILVDSLKQIQETMRDVQDEIKGICTRFPEYGCLLTIPGFGPDISSKVLAAIGNPARFQSSKQVLKLAGLDLSANRSGQRNDPPIISKRGRSSLRYALYQAALLSSYHNAHFREYFTQKLAGREKEKGIKTKMRVKLASKLLVIAWTLMKNREPFDVERLESA